MHPFFLRKFYVSLLSPPAWVDSEFDVAIYFLPCLTDEMMS